MIVLVVNGLALTSGKILIEGGYFEESIIFYLVVFSTALLVSVPLTIKYEKKHSRVDFVSDTTIGVFNAGSNLFLIMALATIPGSIAFSFYGSGALLTTVAISVIILKEQIVRINKIGIVLSIAAVILINL